MRAPAIGGDRCVRLADGVAFDGSELRDTMRVRRLPLNGTGILLVAALPASVDDLCGVLRTQFPGRPADDVEHDVRVFVGRLVDALLLDVDREDVAWRVRLRLLLMSAPAVLAGGRPTFLGSRPPRRVALPPRRVAAAAILAQHLLPYGARLAAAGAIALTAAMLSLGLFSLASLAGFALALVVGPFLHETGHALVLGHNADSLVLRGGRAWIGQRAGTPRSPAAAAAGPGLCVAAALGALAAAPAVGSPVLAATGLMLALHAISFTALTHDGRTASC